MSVEMEIRLATADDLVSLLAIDNACKGATHWSAGVWREALASQPKRAVFLALHGGQAWGFAVGMEVAGVAELEHLCVLPQQRRHGLGRALVAQVIGWAREHGACALELEVRASNTAAIALYAQMGFVEQGRRTQYYTEPLEDAVLMALALS